MSLLKQVSLFVVIAFLSFTNVSRAEEGWVTILSGNDLTQNWTITGNWTLKDGVATLTPREGERGWSRFDAYLWSKMSYADFEIEFEYMVQPKGNSGFYFRVGDVKNPVTTGIEVQIYDSAGKSADAKLTDHDSGGVIPGLPPAKNAAKPAGEWNKFQITNKADKLTIVLNGVTVNEVDLNGDKLKTRPKAGPIGFQDHALPLSLRNIRIRPL